MDLFRWHSESQSQSAMEDGDSRNTAMNELADIVICALAFANRTGIDIAYAVNRKVQKNAEKYPVEKFRGRF